MGLQVSALHMGASSFHNLVETDRKFVESRIRQWGVINRVHMPGDFTVSPHASLHSILISAGMAFIAPKGLAVGTYYAYSDGTDTIALPAVNPTNPFIVAVILRVADDQYGTVTGTKGARYDLISGTPAGSPVAPTDATIDALGVPGGWMRLCDVRINSADTANIPVGQFTIPLSAKRLASPPFCSIQATSPQNFTHASSATVAMDTTLEDTDGGMADLANERIVINTPGVYDLQAGLAWVFNATGDRALNIMAGPAGSPVQVGTDWRGGALVSPHQSSAIASRRWRMAAGDVVFAQGYQSSGITLASSAFATGPFVSALWVAP